MTVPSPSTGLTAIPGKSAGSEKAPFPLNVEATPKNISNSTPVSHSYTNAICIHFPHSEKFVCGKTVLGFLKSITGTKQGEEPRVRMNGPWSHLPPRWLAPEPSRPAWTRLVLRGPGPSAGGDLENAR